MNRARLIWEVARWEFLRFFRLKDLAVTLVVTVVAGGVFLGGGKALLERTQAKKARIVVLNGELLPFRIAEERGITQVDAAGRGETELREAVGRREIDGLLVLRSMDEAELVVSRPPFWQPELAAALTAARYTARLKLLERSPSEIAALLAPFEIELRYHKAAGQGPGRAEKIFAAGFVMLMLLGILVGNAYLFTGITGEKQLRVTEQVVAAIGPQTWIDGKILGLSAMAVVSVVTLGAGTLLAAQVARGFGQGDEIPLALIHPALLLQLLVLAVLGFLMWFAFFAAIAATIDDPNSSARSAFLFLPLAPLAFAFAALRNPDAWLLKLLGAFPLTSPTVLPSRLVLTEVAAWEFPVAVLLLTGMIWVLRRAAGKIFALGILLYGKEPSGQEMWRGLKEA